jgi:putative FmdB family regulatory protein
MPTYEYQCPEGHEFDRLQKMTDKSRVKCPVCGKLATRKISGGAGLVFKGTGFYITDYGKDGKGPRKPESEGSTAESKPSPEKKAEAGKPDAKPSPPKADAPAKPARSRGEGKASSE